MARSVIVVAAVLALAAAPPALRAASHATASLNDIRVQLVDLAPADGIAPSLSGPPAGYDRTLLFTRVEDIDNVLVPGRLDRRESVELPGLFTAGAVTLGVAGDTASAWSTGEQLRVASVQSNDGIGVTSLLQVDTGRNDDWSYRFDTLVLGPHSEMRINAWADVAVSSDGRCGPTVCPTAFADAWMFGSASDGSAASFAEARVWIAGAGSPVEDRATSFLSFALANDSDAPLSFSVAIGLQAIVTGPDAVSPVPAPPAAGLASSGLLALLAWMRRRRPRP